MQTLTAIALDDERPALEVIETFAERVDQLDLKASFTKTGGALQFLRENPVDLIFLDIRMPAMTGVEFTKLLAPDTMVIFTTSYREYAVESYELKAIDYLLKPFTFKRFNQAIEKALDWYQAKLGAVESPPLLLKVNYGTTRVWPKDIFLVQGMDNYAKLWLKDQQSLLVRITLKELQEMLPVDHFCRVHRSYIVALGAIEFVRNRTIHIQEQEIPISNSYFPSFEQAFKQQKSS
ncbi:MAG: LytTR family DNA-binding domain-containing protein [Saprospiraceae bacterium]|nr:LytTR family DNA-binding domain-containing protein [Saprospiraceae bacterium]